MYKTEFDAQTGGILLIEKQQSIAVEYSPVYHEQMDLFHFDKYWKYEESDQPYMWTDGINYVYRGIRMLSFGEPETIFSDFPVEYINLETIGMELEPIDVDAMLNKNRKLLDSLENNSMNRIFSAFKEYKDKVDAVRVAYSAGKDSTVLLDLVMRTLPVGSYVVHYTDTGMELNSSIELAEKVQKECLKHGVNFSIIQSEHNAADMWERIGHPTMANRWCCSVMKSVPSMLHMKKEYGKSNAKELLFAGNRAWESARRSQGEITVTGIKNTGTTLCNAIMEWNSAEVYLYIMNRGLVINEGYRKGLRRIGCKVCPMASISGTNKNMQVYPDESRPWLDIIARTYDLPGGDSESRRLLIESNSWKDRIGGVGTNYPDRYREYRLDGRFCVEYENPKTDWKMWMKTIGVLSENENAYTIIFRGKEYQFECYKLNDSYRFVLNEPATKDDEFMDYFLIVLRKACYCENCYSCESNCPNNCITSIAGKLSISDDCRHCASCHLHKNNCYVYKSQYRPNNVC